MTSAKEIARAFVEMILSEDIEYMDILDFAEDYHNPNIDVIKYSEVHERVLEYMVEIRENFKLNG